MRKNLFGTAFVCQLLPLFPFCSAAATRSARRGVAWCVTCLVGPERGSLRRLALERGRRATTHVGGGPHMSVLGAFGLAFMAKGGWHSAPGVPKGATPTTDFGQSREFRGLECSFHIV